MAPSRSGAATRPRRRRCGPGTAADELALAELGGTAAAGAGDPGRVIVVNDAWGALSVGLAQLSPVVWTDSALARASIDANLERNGMPVLGDRSVPGDQTPAGPFDTAVVVVPKSIALLQWQMMGLAAQLSPGAKVIAVAMTRHLSRAVVECLEATLGPVTQRLAERKARILDVTIAGASAPAAVPVTQLAFTTDEGIEVHEAPGVFSAGHLDVGTALLLDTITELVPDLGERVRGEICDLGSGNGVIGATLGSRFPDANVTMLDVSDLAVQATTATWQANGLDAVRCTMLAADGFGDSPAGSFDLIVTNPPFHQDHAADQGLTDRLLRDAAAQLHPGDSERASGIAVIVAQRHLKLHRRAERWFSSVEVRSQHPTHVVLYAQR